ncbi:MAG: hypothetical protein OXI20_04285 [Rhodospirillales bacterium]|nr:hypothetical protein [Rhodospirillales bacterium]
MNEHESQVKRRRRRTSSTRTPPPRWPGDPEQGDGIDVDVEAVAHVLANTCRWGGRTRRFLSLAQHALAVSEEIEALDGIDGEDRRALALHALLMPGRAAWLGDEKGDLPASARAAARARVQGAAIDRAVREAAGLDPELPEDRVELLRFVERMCDAAERRDLGVDAGGFPFPPLQRTIRPMAPEAAAERWLGRFRELAGSANAGNSANGPDGGNSAGPPRVGETREGAGAAENGPAPAAAEASS